MAETETVRKPTKSSTAKEVVEGLDLSDRTYFITGANSGLGFETARALCSAGGHVVMGCRNVAAAEEAKSKIVEEYPEARINVIPLDLASLQSVSDCAKRYSDTGWPLHCLILNAGVYNPEPRVTEDGLETTFQVNHLSHFYLAKLLTPILSASSPSRIVVVAAEAYKKMFLPAVPEPPVDPEAKRSSAAKSYALSKLLNIHFAAEYNRQHAGKEVTAYSVHPGMIKTNIDRRAPGIAAWKTFCVAFLSTTEQGAATQTYLASAPDDVITKNSGLYFYACKPTSLSAKGKDEKFSKASWEASERLLESLTEQKSEIKRSDDHPELEPITEGEEPALLYDEITHDETQTENIDNKNEVTNAEPFNDLSAEGRDSEQDQNIRRDAEVHANKPQSECGGSDEAEYGTPLSCHNADAAIKNQDQTTDHDPTANDGGELTQDAPHDTGNDGDIQSTDSHVADHEASNPEGLQPQAENDSQPNADQEEGGSSQQEKDKASSAKDGQTDLTTMINARNAVFAHQLEMFGKLRSQKANKNDAEADNPNPTETPEVGVANNESKLNDESEQAEMESTNTAEGAKSFSAESEIEVNHEDGIDKKTEGTGSNADDLVIITASHETNADGNAGHSEKPESHQQEGETGVHEMYESADEGAQQGSSHSDGEVHHDEEAASASPESSGGRIDDDGRSASDRETVSDEGQATQSETSEHRGVDDDSGERWARYAQEGSFRDKLRKWHAEHTRPYPDIVVREIRREVGDTTTEETREERVRRSDHSSFIQVEHRIRRQQKPST